MSEYEKYAENFAADIIDILAADPYDKRQALIEYYEVHIGPLMDWA